MNILKYPVNYLLICLSNPKLTTIFFIFFSLFSLSFTTNNLSIVTSTEKLISENSDFKKNQKLLRTEFPILSNNIVIVLEGDDDLFLENKTEQILKKFQFFSENLEFIYSPNLDSFFKNNAMILMNKEKREQIINNLYDYQPFLSEINNNPKLKGFNNLLELVIKDYKYNENNESINKLSKIISLFNQSIINQTNVNWKKTFTDQKFYNYIILKPSNEFLKDDGFSKIYDFINNIRINESDININFTGGQVLDYEEVESVVEGAILAGILSLVLVSVLLWLAIRNIYVICSLLLSIIVGLSITLGLTTFFIGSLNIISVAFAVLFIGISVDFGIQLCLRSFEMFSSPTLDGISKSTKSISSSLFIVTITSMIGFLSFIPTDYVGLSELGIISSIGLLVGLKTNLTFLPCLLLIFKKNIRGNRNFSAISYLNSSIDFLYKNKLKSLFIFLIIFLAGILFSRSIVFDSDPMKLKDQNAQSVVLALRLMEKNPSSDYTISVFKKEFDQQKINTLKKNSIIKDIFRLSDLEISEDLNEELKYLKFLYSTKSIEFYSDFIELKRFLSILEFITEMKIEPISSESEKLFLNLKSKIISEEEFKDIQNIWFLNFNLLIKDVIHLLDYRKLDLDEVPLYYKERYFSDTGFERIEIKPKEDVTLNENLKEFVNQVEAIYPNSTGMPIIQLKAGNIVVNSFFIAFSISILFLIFFSYFIFRKILYVFFCIFPLVFASLCIIIVMKIFSLNLNFANMISLPLLFSLGTSYSIYLVKRYTELGDLRKMLKSSTPRAVLFSALTTIGSFGTLGFSNHYGTSSMGILLFISLLFAILSCLIILPFTIKLFKSTI